MTTTIGPNAMTLDSETPGSPSEQYMASLWKEIIGLEQVKLPHKFLEVGGNSLTLNIILTRIEAERGVALDPQRFFIDDTSSLFELSKELDARLAARSAHPQ